MITINRRIFGTENTISEMIEKIVLQGMLEETNFKLPEVKLSDAQVEWIKEFISPEGKIVHLDGERATGRSSMGIGMILATSLFKDNSTSLVITTNEQIIKSLYNKLLTYLRIFCEVFSLPELIKTKRRDEIELINGSRIKFSKSHSYVGRGVAADSIFLDLINAKTIESLDEELIASLLPCIYRPGNKMIISLGA